MFIPRCIAKGIIPIPNIPFKFNNNVTKVDSVKTNLKQTQNNTSRKGLTQNKRQSQQRIRLHSNAFKLTKADSNKH